MSPRESTAMPCGDTNWPGPVPPAGSVAMRARFSRVRKDAQSRPEVRRIAIEFVVRTDFPDVAKRALARRHVHSAWTMQIVPLRLESTVPIEDLDAVIFPVGDVHPAIGIARYVVRQVELPRTGARLAPRFDAPAVLRILVHARVAVSVRHVDFIVGRQRGVRTPSKRFAAHERRRR